MMSDYFKGKGRTVDLKKIWFIIEALIKLTCEANITCEVILNLQKQ